MKAVFFDVDGTLTTTRIWGGLMEYFRVHRLRRATHVAFLTYHYPLYFLKRLGLISEVGFRKPWAAHLGWYFRHYQVDTASQIWDWVVEQYVNLHWREDIVAKLSVHLNEGDLVLLVSGGPEPLLQRIAREIGVEHVVGTKFEVENGLYTGNVAGPVCIDDQKATLTKKYLVLNNFEVDLASSYAYADSLSDVALLKLVGNPRPTYPNPELKQYAKENGWLVFPDI
jgi:HAD superfamily hydrolase (TIGR01490 family)